MNMRNQVLERFAASPGGTAGKPVAPQARAARPAGGGSPLFLPDLTLWYRWHRERGSFPPGWEGATLPEICRRRELPLWLPVRPWRLEHKGLTVETTKGDDVRETRWRTSRGTLLARWTLGPDGDWWQTDYPATTAEELSGVREIVESIAYLPDPAEAERAAREIGNDGVTALELPMRPLSDLLHSYLGWSEGLLLLWEEPAVIAELAGVLEEKLQGLLGELTSLPGDLYLSPDNLDAQFVSPALFAEHLAPSYRASAAALAGKPLVVHAGGPLRPLLPHLGACGVTAVEGISGPPQGDANLAEAREIAGPGLTLWGGIPQDAVLATADEGVFASALGAALEQARQPGMILGVADRVPPEALPERLEAIRQAGR